VDIGYALAQEALAPMGYWRFGEASGTTAYDVMTTHDGTYTNGVDLGHDGALNGDADTAAYFDGINDYVNVGTLGDLGSHMSSGLWTSFWIKTSRTSSMSIMGCYDDVNENNFNVSMNSTDIYSGFRGFSVNIGYGPIGGLVMYASGSWSDSQWHHVVLNPVVSDASVYIWVDGVRQTSITKNIMSSSSVFTNFGYSILIGASLYSPSTIIQPMTGYLDEVAIGLGVLTDEQVGTLYVHGTRPSIGFAMPYAGEETASIDVNLTGWHHMQSSFDYQIRRLNPTSYWKFDETSGTTASDSVGDNDATHVNGVTVGADSALSEVVGAAITLDGVDDYLTIGSMGTFGSQMNGGIWAMGWIKVTDSSPMILLFCRDDALSQTLSIALNTTADAVREGALSCLLSNTTYGTLGAYADLNINDSIWHHVAILVDPSSTTISIWMDGEAVAVTTEYDTLSASAVFSNFGQYSSVGVYNYTPYGGLFQQFNGSIDELAIGLGTISDIQVANIYLASQPKFLTWSMPLVEKPIYQDNESQEWVLYAHGETISSININTGGYYLQRSLLRNTIARLNPYAYWQLDELSGSVA